uniref:Transmembrane protein n=1 Tax=Knipowitschia caucasica TaxID=637954 RepID=A0AAV2MKV1_KNICA
MSHETLQRLKKPRPSGKDGSDGGFGALYLELDKLQSQKKKKLLHVANFSLINVLMTACFDLFSLLPEAENTHPSLSLYLSISNGERNSILIQIQRFPSFFKPILALFVHFLIYIYF